MTIPASEASHQAAPAKIADESALALHWLDRAQRIASGAAASDPAPASSASCWATPPRWNAAPARHTNTSERQPGWDPQAPADRQRAAAARSAGTLVRAVHRYALAEGYR